MTQEQRSWHLEKKLTIGILFAIMANTTIVVWSAATLWSDVQDLNTLPAQVRKVQDDQIRLKAHVDALNGVVGKMGIVLTNFEQTLDRIDREQSRRKPIVDRAERDLFNGDH